MKTLIENWNNFVNEQNDEEQDTLDQIKDSPKEATDLIKKVATADNKQRKAILQTLIKDPEIADTIKILQGLASEQNLDEGALADKMLQTYIKGDIAAQKFFDSPAGKQIAKYGGPVLALALLALKIDQPPTTSADLKAMIKLASSASPGTAAAADSVMTVMSGQPTE